MQRTVAGRGEMAMPLRHIVVRGEVSEGVAEDYAAARQCGNGAGPR
ncbi:MAG: hypothetical protein ACRDGW_07920 [Actinomycetota bacterium]